jgi:phage head maturation protease
MDAKEIGMSAPGAVEVQSSHSTTHSGPRLVGYAAVFDSLSHDLGGFRERIKRGAFADSIRRRDILALYSHSYDSPLART